MKKQDKKSNTIPAWIHMSLVLIGMAISAGAIFMPWAKASIIMGITSKVVYPYQEKTLYPALIIHIIAILIIFVLNLYVIVKPKGFLKPIIIFLIGVGIIGFGIYIWQKIEANDVAFLGINPLKIANVYPDIGILMIIIGGGFISLSGLLYVIKPSGKEK